MRLTLEAQQLIIQLLNEELRRSNRLPTKHYHKEIEDAKENFIEFITAADYLLTYYGNVK